MSKLHETIALPNDDKFELNPGPVMVTFTFDHNRQAISKQSYGDSEVIKNRYGDTTIIKHYHKTMNHDRLIRSRFRAVNRTFLELILPIIKKCFISYEVNLEVTQRLASNTPKIYPRLHYHLVGTLQMPYYFLMSAALLVNNGIGYHVARLEQEQCPAKFEYIRKQRELMIQLIEYLEIEQEMSLTTTDRTNIIQFGPFESICKESF